MQVLDDEEEGTLLRAVPPPGEEGFLGLRLLPLRGEGERRIALGQRQREQGREQGHGLGKRIPVLGQERLQLAQLLGRRLLRKPPQQALQVRDHRIQRALLVIGRAAPLHAVMPLAFHAFLDDLDEARLADAGLAAKHDHVSLAILHTGPAFQEQRELPVAAHQGGDAAARGAPEAALGIMLAHDAEHLDRGGHALDRVRPQFLTGESSLDQAPGGGADHDRVGRGEALEPGGHVRRVAQRQPFLATATAHRAHDHQAGMDAHPDRQLDPALGHEALVQPSHGLHHAEGGAHGALAIVLVRLRVAEVDEQAVAEVLGDVPLEALDHLGAHALVCAYHLAQFLRIQAGGEGGRADQVAEEHGEVAPFRLR